MRIETIKLVKVKEEYMNSMEGQDKLVSIINGDVNCDHMIEYKITNHVISAIFMEDYYIKNYWYDKEYTKERAVHALLFGVSDFNYTYTPWETQLRIKNPTKEQIAETIIEMWDIDPEDKEEIEMMEGSLTNHDNLGLRYMSVENLKKAIRDLEDLDILNRCKEVEKELNSNGISFDEISEKDIKFIESLKEFIKEAIKDGNGVVYAFDEV